MSPQTSGGARPRGSSSTPSGAHARADALRLLDHIQAKFKLFQGHRVRAAAQDLTLEEIIKQLSDAALSGNMTVALLIIDCSIATTESALCLVYPAMIWSR